MPGVSPEDLESSPGFLAAADAVVADDYLLPYDDSANTLRPMTFGEVAKTIAKARPSALNPTQQILTVGSGTYTRPTNCTSIRVHVIAGGGGGGGCAGHASQGGCGSGGGAGGYAMKLITSPDATYAYTVGAKGGGASAGANNGSNGADSTFGAGGGLITAKGGGGGVAGALGTTMSMLAPGAGGEIATGGDINAMGGHGKPSWRNSATSANGGQGGDSELGAGATNASSNSDGVAATTPGSGGSGGRVESVNTARAGGAGADGLIVVEEFYG